jgi:hypothetical protein
LYEEEREKLEEQNPNWGQGPLRMTLISKNPNPWLRLNALPRTVENFGPNFKVLEATKSEKSTAEGGPRHCFKSNLDDIPTSQRPLCPLLGPTWQMCSLWKSQLSPQRLQKVFCSEPDTKWEALHLSEQPSANRVAKRIESGGAKHAVHKNFKTDDTHRALGTLYVTTACSKNACNAGSSFENSEICPISWGQSRYRNTFQSCPRHIASSFVLKKNMLEWFWKISFIWEKLK